MCLFKLILSLVHQVQDLPIHLEFPSPMFPIPPRPVDLSLNENDEYYRGVLWDSMRSSKRYPADVLPTEPNEPLVDMEEENKLHEPPSGIEYYPPNFEHRAWFQAYGVSPKTKNPPGLEKSTWKKDIWETTFGVEVPKSGFRESRRRIHHQIDDDDDDDEEGTEEEKLKEMPQQYAVLIDKSVLSNG